MTQSFDFDSEYFAKNYHYDGCDLGAVTCDEYTAFKLWAPTASRVVLQLFSDGHTACAYKTVDMIRGEFGVWHHKEKCSHGTYYTYLITVGDKTHESADPYAKACGVNGERGMVTNLSLTNPDGWDSSALKNPIRHYSEAVIYELHVRDFSSKLTASRFKGKYLAFTESGLVNEYGISVGIDYIRALGVTHVHLLPVADFASVDEANPNATYNWGYDPQNFNTPEGSYSTDPYNAAVRIRELKSAIMSLHRVGIGVILDVVYNHTYLTESVLEKTVPGYYYRYKSGERTNLSGCGNDTASERYMFRKFMVDSVAYWMREYKLDGLRFDLMGLHDIDTMQEIERAVHEINPSAIIYGEGWDMGGNFGVAATQKNIGKILTTSNAIGAIAVFNDVMRDGLKGSTFYHKSRGYINGDAEDTSGKVLFGICGATGGSFGWSVNVGGAVNYMSAHDNHTLWDKLCLSNPDSTDEERMRMNKFGAAILMISRGPVFFQAGEEMLRTKSGDENSYRSGDEINGIDWSGLKLGSLQHETALYYKGLIKMRCAFNIFTTENGVAISAKTLLHGALAVTALSEHGKAVVIINPHSDTIGYELDGELNLIANGEVAGTDIISKDSGSICVPPLSIRVYVSDGLL